MHVVATAGHVDHGKSTLVLALTGMDPDRFVEEKERGLTIDLGFAWATLPSGREVGFVDVPGHVRFLKNMLAGVGAVDACVFVVAATEGWKPQSEEHLRILEVLGVRHGLVALTKVGLVDEEWRELATLDVADRVAGTFLEGAPVVGVDAPSGGGVGELTSAIDAVLAVTPTAVDRDRPRLWIDRAFAARGSGTVVTGTLTGGSLRVDDELLVLPAGRRARVRALQTHKSALDVATPGRRLAVNLVGISHGDVTRGDVLVRAGQWEPSGLIDCSLSVLAALDHDVGRRGAYHAYIGSGEHRVRLRVLGAESIAPGDTGAVRLYVPVDLPLRPGDRYVLRETGRGETVGGGEVIDVAPVLPAAKARPSRSVDRVVAERGWVDAALLERLTGEALTPNAANWVVAPAALEQALNEVRAAVRAAGPLGLDVASLDEKRRAVLDLVPEITVSGGRARAGDQPDVLASHPYLAALASSPFAPPTPEESGADRAEVRALVRAGRIVESDGMFFAPAAVDDAARVVAELLAATPDGVTASAIREALGTSRKYLLPLLGVLDGRGITRRRGDLRVAGPRLAEGRD